MKKDRNGMILKSLNLSNALYDKIIICTDSFQLEHNGIKYNLSIHQEENGIFIHIADGGSALAVFPRSANAITIKPLPYV